jgi:hypothetical protein
MPKTLILISILIISLFIYLYNSFTLREGFKSKIREKMVGNARRAKRHIKKNIEEFKNNMVYKIKSKLRILNF